MNQNLLGLSSMATRPILTALCDHIGREHGIPVRFDAAGGVETARRVRDGAQADLLVLAEEAVNSLEREGHLLAGSVRPLFVSRVVAAVRDASPVPVLDTESDLRSVLLSASRIAYSTGPSGTAITDLIARFGLTDVLGDRLVQAPPGVPVGEVLSSGGADLGFQQQSELMDLPGVVVVGALPGDTAIESTFCGGVLTCTGQEERARDVLGILGSEAAAATVRARGMRTHGHA
ncbi:substrate-binding domain-containing protein [Streptomyces griseoluteus]|uniref:substrate-binding domain-containing protein n=1 Tax=Streptomyces griseoluteus TaxID=29306 RepID=UPI00381F234F